MGLYALAIRGKRCRRKKQPALMSSRENTVLRAELDPGLVSVIPNAIVSAQFRPAPSLINPKYSTA
jgi:hypothetical protein